MSRSTNTTFSLCWAKLSFAASPARFAANLDIAASLDWETSEAERSTNDGGCDFGAMNCREWRRTCTHQVVWTAYLVCCFRRRTLQAHCCVSGRRDALGCYSPGPAFYMVLQPNCLLYFCNLASLTGTQVKHRARAPT